MACLFTTAYLLQTIRAILNEKSAVRWIDDQLNKWVQEASIDISTKTGCYEQTHVFQTSENTLEYDEPDGCVKALGCLKGGVGTSYDWAQHFDNEDMQYLGHPEWWDGEKWNLLVPAGGSQSRSLSVNGSWYVAYRPTHVKVTYTGVALDGFSIIDANDDTIGGAIDNSYVSGTELVLTFGSYDLSRLQFEVPAGTCSITDIQFYESSSVYDTDYRGLSQIHPRLVGHLPLSLIGEPYHWYHHHSKIGIYPVPDDEYIVTAFYSKVTETITDLPCCMRWLAVPYTLAMARLSEGWKDDFEMFMAMYLNNLMFHRGDICRTSLMAEAKDNFFIPEGR